MRKVLTVHTVHTRVFQNEKEAKRRLKSGENIKNVQHIMAEREQHGSECRGEADIVREI